MRNRKSKNFPSSKRSRCQEHTDICFPPWVYPIIFARNINHHANVTRIPPHFHFLLQPQQWGHVGYCDRTCNPSQHPHHRHYPWVIWSWSAHGARSHQHVAMLSPTSSPIITSPTYIYAATYPDPTTSYSTSSFITHSNTPSLSFGSVL